MKYIEIGSFNPDNCYYKREACYGIYLEDGKLLLALNIERNQIEMIGGGKQIDESNEDCLSREFMEEIGSQIEGVVPFVDIKCYWESDYAHVCTLAHFFIVDKIHSVGTSYVDHKVQFVALEEAVRMLNLLYQKEAINLYLKKLKQL